VLVLESLVGLHKTIQLQILANKYSNTDSVTFKLY